MFHHLINTINPIFILFLNTFHLAPHSSITLPIFYHHVQSLFNHHMITLNHQVIIINHIQSLIITFSSSSDYLMII